MATAERWDVPARQAERTMERGASFSGRERNRVFLDVGAGDGFVDVSEVSGLDDVADGRSLAVLDMDQDGWPDLAVANANAPTLRLFRRQPGDAGQGFVAVELEGGNHAAAPSDTWSNRDAVGAVVEVRAGARTLVRSRRLGEGFSAQNSATLLIGVGAVAAVDLTVRWPSGRRHTAAGVPVGSRVLVQEREAGARVRPYGPPGATRP